MAEENNDPEENNLDYASLNRRIDKARRNPMFGISQDDIRDLTKTWLDSYSKLRDPKRRTISENLNFPELLKLIAPYPHIKTATGYLLYVGNLIVSVLGGAGAFCDDMTYEVALVDSDNNFVTSEYDPSIDMLKMSLHYQDLIDIDNILNWCKNRGIQNG